MSSTVNNNNNYIVSQESEQFIKVENRAWVVISFLLREITGDRLPNCAAFTGEMQEYCY